LAPLPPWLVSRWAAASLPRQPPQLCRSPKVVLNEEEKMLNQKYWNIFKNIDQYFTN
jgi:hypothetical protein